MSTITTTINSYKALKDRHAKEWNEIPIFFAFSNEQFNEGMKKLGLEPTDTDKIFSLKGTGGFMRRTDEKLLDDMTQRQARERKEAITADTTGDGYIFDMFYYELGNHEFTYTGSTGQTLDALGLTMKDINKDKRLKHGLDKAIKAQWEWDNSRD